MPVNLWPGTLISQKWAKSIISDVEGLYIIKK
jgi:hypothetical protein